MTTVRTQPQIEAELKRIRSLHLLMAAILISYLPAMIVLYLMQLPELLIIYSAVAMISVGIVVAFVIGFARCPVCNQYFHLRGVAGNIFVKKCMNCGTNL